MVKWIKRLLFCTVKNLSLYYTGFHNALYILLIILMWCFVAPFHIEEKRNAFINLNRQHIDNSKSLCFHCAGGVETYIPKMAIQCFSKYSFICHGTLEMCWSPLLEICFIAALTFSLHPKSNHNSTQHLCLATGTELTNFTAVVKHGCPFMTVKILQAKYLLHKRSKFSFLR